MKFKKLISLAVGAAMVLSMSVSAFAVTYPASAEDSGLYGQFYKAASGKQDQVSMVQKALVNETAKYVYDEYEDTYDLYFATEGFDMTMGLISGSGYMTSVDVTVGNNTYSGTVTEDAGTAVHEGTLAIMGVSSSDYAALKSAKNAAAVGYEVKIIGDYSHSDSDALFKLETTYTAY